MEWKKQKANYRNKNERFNIGYRVRINQERCKSKTKLLTEIRQMVCVSHVLNKEEN